MDGATVLSESFPIRCGVVQGDIISPVYFILALELILRKYDTHPNKGIDFGGRRIHTMGYSDDAVLIDTDPDTVTVRVTLIVIDSLADVDM